MELAVNYDKQYLVARLGRLQIVARCIVNCDSEMSWLHDDDALVSGDVSS